MGPLKTILSVALAACWALPVFAADLDPIVIKGSRFFYKTSGQQFFIKGVAYQDSDNTVDSYNDPLANPKGCRRDVPLLKELHANVVRVYAIHPEKNHDECMRLFADAGIYVLADLAEPSQSINRDTPEWDVKLYDRYTSVIDSLAKYTNVIGFFAGNEVTNDRSTTDVSAFVKAAVRDMKAYIYEKGYRQMGIGYATDDDADIRRNLAAYFDCGIDDERIDFWGYNIYEWCGDSTFETSGYADRTKEFAKYNVPVFFAEYGCNTIQPRRFSEVQAIYGPQMTGVWSGGIVYMYFQEQNNYGLVDVSGSGIKKLPDFTAFANQMAKVSPKGPKMAAYTPVNTENAPCPTVSSGVWEASPKLPPTPDRELCDCMTRSITCRAKSTVPDEDLSRLFSTVCGLSPMACEEIASNATSGVYGMYGMCSPIDQLSWAFNTYYEEQLKRGNGHTACDFGGAAATQTAVKQPVCTVKPQVSIKSSKSNAPTWRNASSWDVAGIRYAIFAGLGLFLF
ncbi:1,3-beta-glucanosyltransferase gel3 [Nannizzia gypsea CBS 118893]|uniref:1,3-beta-glucanosyltransferase n=1 Tax=Arthroderma gypseum (strain ATCC MYA-4604 / CBS 118893) TaxID=535722 RepID=E4V3L5_ARTGP|nr:1,3-beta-glucanosyltransferase gel3 [Nannizzia gypsea CBS 118893]EFR04589.1 1,3-beta-glucanosyltransferase gel3 [Nannizzia gypsea CBS 118893]